MRAVVIPTPNLDLILQTPAELIARIEALDPADRAEVSPEWLARVHTTKLGDFWRLGFCVVERTSGAVIGDCGFKGPPDSSECVEIAYGIAPEYRGRGYATEAAQGLIEFAVDRGGVRAIRAHTRPEANASTRVLTKCGFLCVGEVTDPEDGLVWRWEKHPGDGD